MESSRNIGPRQSGLYTNTQLQLCFRMIPVAFSFESCLGPSLSSVSCMNMYVWFPPNCSLEVFFYIGLYDKVNHHTPLFKYLTPYLLCKYKGYQGFVFSFWPPCSLVLNVHLLFSWLIKLFIGFIIALGIVAITNLSTTSSAAHQFSSECLGISSYKHQYLWFFL